MTLEKVKEFALQRKVIWSQHVATRMMERGIERGDVLNCIRFGEMIEDYPTDFPNPSCLIFGYSLGGKVLHVVAGCDENQAFIITAYYPNTQKFCDDLKTRRK